MRFDRKVARWGAVTFVALSCAFGIVMPVWVLVAALGVATVMLIVAARRGAREDRTAHQRAAQLRRLPGIVERKVRERTMWLEDELAQYRAIVENLDAVAFECDVRKQSFLYIAPQAAALLECAADELTPAFMLGCVHDDDRAAVESIIRRGYQTEPVDCRLVTKTGRVVHVRTFMSARVGSRRLRGLILDVTREKQLEQELRQAHKLESVGRLAAGVAHELNTPIQYIANSIDFVRDALADLENLDADRAYLLENIPRALDRASIGVQNVANIVRTMKAFTHEVTETCEVDINTKIEDTLAIASNEYRYDADVVTDLGDVPSVWCDPADLRQVLLAIVVNAAQAIREQQRRGCITITSRSLRGEVVVSIADTGPGIPDAIRDRIFEPFFTTKQIGQGVGQSLAAARALIVERYHGKLTFDTQVGRGTTFTIRLPAHVVQKAAA